VGDIGDNDGRRSSIEIAQVAVGAGDRTVTPTTYRLTYPDGATDAEALLRDPATGRLYVATKNVFGGKLYAVPEDLEPSGTHQMEPVGRVLPIVTDGSFFPDGEHLIVRNYTSAAVYDWPSLQRIGSFALPRQRQGEGLAVADDGRIYLSSEGIDSQVLEVTLPPRIEAAMGPSASTPESSEPPGTPPDEQDADGGSRDPWPWIAGGLLGVGALLVLLRALRPRGSGERRPSG
jgi:hypothetical protein